MNIAVTYDNGEIFQHFGHTEEFKVYEIKDGNITGSEIIKTGGSGHGHSEGGCGSHGSSSCGGHSSSGCGNHTNHEGGCGGHGGGSGCGGGCHN